MFLRLVKILALVSLVLLIAAVYLQRHPVDDRQLIALPWESRTVHLTTHAADLQFTYVTGWLNHDEACRAAAAPIQRDALANVNATLFLLVRQADLNPDVFTCPPASPDAPATVSIVSSPSVPPAPSPTPFYLTAYPTANPSLPPGEWTWAGTGLLVTSWRDTLLAQRYRYLAVPIPAISYTSAALFLVSLLFIVRHQIIHRSRLRLGLCPS